MPIRIPDALPARQVLKSEGVSVMPQAEADRQDIRPMKFALLNLMPNKKKTEIQISRLLGATPLQIELTLMNTASYQSKNTEPEHLFTFYNTLEDVRHEKFDGLVITGAPIETKPFQEVAYWQELEQIFEWAQKNVHSTFSVCWGAQAMLHHFHGIEKHELPTKKFGIYRHRNLDSSDPLMVGLNDTFSVPVSRHTEVLTRDVKAKADLKVLAQSYGSGLCLVAEHSARRYYMFNHLEYDADDLDLEYKRDLEAGQPIEMPVNYYPDDNPNLAPQNDWRGMAHLLFGNWINLVYQSTPFDENQIGSG